MKINDNRFRLAAAGIGTTLSNANYISKQFVGMTSVGSGEHIFNYPPITVTVKGTIGINTVSPEDYHAKINPIVRGFDYINKCWESWHWLWKWIYIQL